MATDPQQAGIDRSSSAADIRDALSRMSAGLQTQQRDGRWVAELDSGGISGEGDTEDEAAWNAWTSYVAEQGGTGAS